MTPAAPTRPDPTSVNEAGCAAARRPQQERGERRVQAILDAAAALVAEGGTERLTVQMLAERARTSKGSLYHFFPDLQSVLRALGERHHAAITDLTGAMIADRSIQWTALSADEAARRFLAPLAYLAANPDLLALVRSSIGADQSGRRLSPLRDLAEHLLRERCGALSRADRQAAAMTMVGMLDGVVGYALRTGESTPAAVAAQLRRALGAYLASLDAASATARGSGGRASRPVRSGYNDL